MFVRWRGERGSGEPVCSSGNCDISSRISTETLIDLDCNFGRNNSERGFTEPGRQSSVISLTVGWAGWLWWGAILQLMAPLVESLSQSLPATSCNH